MMAAMLFSAMPQGAKVEHEVNGSKNCAIDAVGGDIDIRAPAGDIDDGFGVGRVRRSVGRGDAGAQLHQVVNVAREAEEHDRWWPMRLTGRRSNCSCQADRRTARQ